MTDAANPDLFRPMDVPDRLRPYVRRVLVADTDQFVDFEIDVRATGYHYFGWIWRGSWQGIVSGEVEFDSDVDGQIHLSGQVDKSIVTARFQRDVGQLFLEFTALGHYQLLGITGSKMLESAVAPQTFNAALASFFKPLTTAGDLSVDDRVCLLADVLSGLPKNAVTEGMIACINGIEAADGDVQITELVTSLGLAERQFRTEFKMLTGLSPKAFCKTLQINRALNELLLSAGEDLAGIAARSGFADQAHFTRAFGAFLGNAPQRFLNDIEVTLARFVGQSRQDEAPQISDEKLPDIKASI